MHGAPNARSAAGCLVVSSPARVAGALRPASRSPKRSEPTKQRRERGREPSTYRHVWRPAPLRHESCSTSDLPQLAPRKIQNLPTSHNGCTTRGAGSRLSTLVSSATPRYRAPWRSWRTCRRRPVRTSHNPRVLQRPNGHWVVECRQCSEDRTSAVPIGIGMPLPDKLTAERLAQNHRTPVAAVR